MEVVYVRFRFREVDVHTIPRAVHVAEVDLRVDESLSCSHLVVLTGFVQINLTPLASLVTRGRVVLGDGQTSFCRTKSMLYDTITTKGEGVEN